MPRAAAQEALSLDDEQGRDQIGDEKGDGTANLMQRSLFQSGEERKQNENGASDDDLPFEMAPVGLMGAHARGRVSNLV